MQTPPMVQIKAFRTSPNVQKFAAGDVLFSTGERGDVMYAILDGEVDLMVGDAVVETVGTDGILGEMALIDFAPRSATAVARTNGRLVRVDHERFTAMVDEHPTFALQVMRVMAARLRAANG
jgi:CRP/FNR family cyclic AMP-dependent transcriptional regulator